MLFIMPLLCLLGGQTAPVTVVKTLPRVMRASELQVADNTEGVAYKGAPGGTVVDTTGVASVVSAKGLRRVSFSGITFVGTGQGFALENPVDVSIDGCSSDRAVLVTAHAAWRLTVTNCVAVDCPVRAIDVHGGLRATHAVSGVVVADCAFVRCGSVQPGAEFEAIRITGYGPQIRRCTFQDCPCAAISSTGPWGFEEESVQACVIDSCRFSRCQTASADGGVIYASGRDPTAVGNQITNSTFEDCGHGAISPCVYLDDLAGGALIRRNAFRRCVAGVKIGGGRSNVLDLNTFTAVGSAIDMDNRGIASGAFAWFHRSGNPGMPQDRILFALGVPGFDSTGYLASMMREPDWFLPKSNQITRNTRDLATGWRDWSSSFPGAPVLMSGNSATLGS